MMKKVALIVGHRSGARGAYNQTLDISEWEWNQMLVERVADSLSACFSLDPIGTYGVILRDAERKRKGIVEDVNSGEYDLAVSFHANASGVGASGCETLYWHNSMVGMTIASVLQDSMVGVLKNRDRGIKPKNRGDRGSYILWATKCPTVILEPFFIDHTPDYLNARKKINRLAYSIARGIHTCLNLLEGS